MKISLKRAFYSILRGLLKEGIIKEVKDTHDGSIKYRKVSIRSNKKKKTRAVDANTRYLQNSLVQLYKDLYPSLIYFLACANSRLLEAPKCPICGDPCLPRKINSTQKLKGIPHYNGYGFIGDCGSASCRSVVKSLRTSKTILSEDSVKKIALARVNSPYKKDIYDKMKRTNLERYGVEYPLQCRDIRRKTIKTKNYKIDNNIFDSSWEVIYFLYYTKILKNSIERVENGIEYKDEEGETHYYFPDFKIGEIYYEIKGEQLLKRDEYGNIIGFRSPYKLKTEASMKKRDSLLSKKFELAKQLKVILITKKDIDFYEKEIIDYFGDIQNWKNYLNSIKINKNKGNEGGFS